MNNRQLKIIKWFQQVETGLAELYEGTVRLLKDKSFPSRERLICHAVREIRNRLPDAVAGKATSSRLEYSLEIEKLAEAYERRGLGSVREQAKQEGYEKRLEREVIVLLEQIIKKHKDVKNIKLENAKRLLIELEPENRQMQMSLVPVIDKWLEETEWFVERTHEGKKVNEDELIERFVAFEDVLLSLVGYFYEGQQELEKLVEETNRLNKKPNKDEVDAIVRRLGRAKYRIYFFDKLSNQYWIEPLKKEGFFQTPNEPKEEEVYERWLEGVYLKKMSSKAPEEVLQLLSKIQSKNPYVRNDCIECLLEMPENIAAKGVGVVTNMLPRGVEEGNFGWNWYGKKAAELMVRLADKYPSEAFKIGWIIMDVWVSQEQKDYRKIIAKFTDRDYRELVLKYFSKLWEVNTWKALWVMFKIINRCLDKLDERDGYDVSSLFYARASLRDLDSIDVGRWDIEPVLLKGICEAGKLLAKVDPSKLSKLLDVFEKSERAIFLRIEMYLLRFVPAFTEKERINKLIGNQKFIESPSFKYEHRHLLNDKFDEVSKETRERFIEWVKEEKYSKERVEEIKNWCEKNQKAKPDFEKMENRAKAEELYLVRERFKDIYEEYKKAAEVKDDSSLAPRKMVSEAYAVSPEEGSPYSSEKMEKDNVEIVINYLLEPKSYESKEEVSGWGTAKDALASSFKADVKKRPMEYLGCDSQKLQKLNPSFLSSLFYGIQDTIRDGSFAKAHWPDLIELIKNIVQNNYCKTDYRSCFSAMLSALRDGFTQENTQIEFDKQTIENLLDIITKLVKYKEDYQYSDYERDPMQMRCSSVKGEASEQIVELGIACKEKQHYEGQFKLEIRQLLNYVVNEVKKPEVNCTLGIDFNRIYYFDADWVKDNVEKMFEGDMWDVVWGTHISWGRPYRSGFELLKKKGIYKEAVEKLNTTNKYKFDKDPEEGFAEHLMIAFFNGWIELEDSLLVKFFHKASAELRGYAARFLTTGFKSVNEEGGKEKEKVTERMRKYWNERLSAIRGNPKENEKEAIELTGWVEDSVLPSKETLELLEKDLDVSGGKIGEMRDAKEFIEGICKLGHGNELLALSCLKKASVDKNMHYTWAGIQEPLVKFLEELPEKMRGEGKDVADLYGRYNPDKFRAVWEKLNVTIGSD